MYSFCEERISFAQKLFIETKSGRESRGWRILMLGNDPIPPMTHLTRPQDPVVMFNDSGLKLR